MRMVRAPLRITLGGGGTDLPGWYKKNGGFLLCAAINKYIAPTALFYFRWGALLTWITGAATLQISGIGIHNAFTLQPGAEVIGIGSWLGTIMLFNVWGLIWPNQKRILGMVEATDEKIAKGKVIALMASRTNTLLSIPMLMCMSSHMHGLPL